MNKFEKACEMSLNEWLATLPDEFPEAEYTEKHHKWLKVLFNKMRGNRYHTFTTKTIKVILVAAALATLLLTAFTLPSSREFFIDTFEKYSTFQLTEDNKNIVAEELIVGYVPEGFVLESKENYDKSSMCYYVSNNGDTFTIYKNSSSIKMDFDNENSVIEEMIIDNQKYIYCQGENEKDALIWTKNDYVYIISGDFSKEELLEIAKNVE